MFVPYPRGICWSPEPQGEGIWGWRPRETIRARGSHEGGALMMQLVAFQEGEERSHSVHTPRKGQQEARWGGGSASWGLRPHQTELTPVTLVPGAQPPERRVTNPARTTRRSMPPTRQAARTQSRFCS